MNGSCPRCQPWSPAFGDAEALCNQHALQVLDEIVDELIVTMKERPPVGNDDPALD